MSSTIFTSIIAIEDVNKRKMKVTNYRVGDWEIFTN